MKHIKRIIASVLSAALIISVFSFGFITASAASLFGDINSSGDINSTDALYMLQMSVGMYEETEESIYLFRQTLTGYWLENTKRNLCVCVCAVLSCFSCVRLCNPMDCSLPGSSGQGILQARIL